jgi:hypothetical protein
VMEFYRSITIAYRPEVIFGGSTASFLLSERNKPNYYDYQIIVHYRIDHYDAK